MTDLERTSPGPLATVHERVPELSSRRGCSECHGGWTTSMSDSCLACHDVIGEQLEQGAGLHGALGRDAGARCAVCHSDHHGAAFSIVNAQSFSFAGVPDREAFDHELVGFRMDGAHMELACDECHANAEAHVLPEGGLRYLGLEQDCASCHEDPHEQDMALTCAQCHGQEQWDLPESLGHERFLPLVGGHAERHCTECHTPGGPHSIRTYATEGAVRPGDRECRDCHDSPHDEGFLADAVQRSSTEAAQGCVACHEAEHTSFREEGLTITSAVHAASGFPLVAPHHELGCAECHAPELSTFVERYPGRGRDECSACHDDPHGGQFEEGPFAGGDCVACHDRTQFDPHTFDVEKHALAALPLTGSHLDLACEDCHELPVSRPVGDDFWDLDLFGDDEPLEQDGPAAGAEHGPAEEPAPEDLPPRIFRGTPVTCDGCHTDAHGGFFDGRSSGSRKRTAEGGDCAACHVTTEFAQLQEWGFDHGRWTGFEVLGAHLQDGCEVCHPRADHPDELGRRFGRVAEHFGDFHGCQTCHADPHDGAFDGPDHPQEVEGREACVRCHVQTSFRLFPGGFEHGLWTGFALDGAHTDVGCARCHEPLRQPDEAGRTWGRALGAACADCHADPHAGQFRFEGATDCRRCHRSAASFSDLSFHHDWDSRFPLGEAHAGLACSECHPSVPWEDSQIVRYRPLGTECVDCHGPDSSAVKRKLGRRR